MLRAVLRSPNQFYYKINGGTTIGTDFLKDMSVILDRKLTFYELITYTAQAPLF